MDILSLAQQHVTLTKQGTTWAGPCPLCGGDKDSHRFVINTAKNFAHCYGCGQNLDPVRFLRKVAGLSCPEAHRQAGVECDRVECPAWDKCSRGRGDRPRTAAPLPRTAAAPVPAVPVATDPAGQWQAKAAELVAQAHQQLLASPDQLSYLAGRGLPREAVEKYRLGYLPRDLFRERSAWGLPPELKDDGVPKKLYIPAGILIPWSVGDGIHRIRIRKQAVRDKKDPRYYWLPGSGNDIICLNPTARAHVVVESDLDGLLIDWLAGDIVATVPLGSCSTHPKASAVASLKESLRILVALDFDTPVWNEQKQRPIAPGAESCAWWSRAFPDTWRRWPVPVGKDPGEAWQQGYDLRAWILAGLPPVFRVQAPAPSAPVAIDAPAPCQPAPVELESSVCTMVAHGGRTYHITDNRAAYDRLVSAGEIVFDSAEIRLVVSSGADKKQAALILAAKKTFPGVRVSGALLDDHGATHSEPSPRYRGKFARTGTGN